MVKISLTPIQTDRKAAKLYLEHWQLGEKPFEAGDDDKQAAIAKKITDLGYPNPNDIVYDNEAVPLIHWKDSNFDCEAYYETIIPNDEQ